MSIRATFIGAARRTPFGRHGGALAGVRADDRGGLPIRASLGRNAKVDGSAVAGAIFACANQAGDGNRHVARMHVLLAGLPQEMPGSTLNRRCGRGLDSVGTAARANRSDEADRMVEGGGETMSCAASARPKGQGALSRSKAIREATIGRRFVNRSRKQRHDGDSTRVTAGNVASEFGIERAARDRLAVFSQPKARAAQPSGLYSAKHLRETMLEALAMLKRVVRLDDTVTVGNAGGVDDGACAAAGERVAGCTPGTRAARQQRRHGDRGHGNARHGHRPGTCDTQDPRADGPASRPDGRRQAEEGTRGAGPGGVARPGLGGRCPARQRERWGDRAGSSAGSRRRTTCRQGHQPTANRRRPCRAVHHGHRCRPGHRRRGRTGMASRGGRP